MARRRKPTATFPLIRNLEEANTALQQLAELDRKLSDVEASLNAKIDRLKEEADREIAEIKAKHRAMTDGLTAFAELQKGEIFKEKRSREVTFGTIGFRRKTVLKPAPKNTWKQVLGRLKELAFVDAIRTRETVNKEVLETWPDTRLETVGVRRVQADEFWYEIKQEEVSDGVD